MPIKFPHLVPLLSTRGPRMPLRACFQILSMISIHIVSFKEEEVGVVQHMLVIHLYIYLQTLIPQTEQIPPSIYKFLLPMQL